MYTWYGVMILSKWPCKFYQYNFSENSRMGRSLLVAETIINGEPFVVSTVHLESMASAPFRKAQMEISFPILKLFNNSMLMGDFNFNSSWKNEQACIDPGFDDIFLTLNNW
jgi:endonuclease/exonuclease/phosphatase family metal-dependent hydrolase